MYLTGALFAAVSMCRVATNDEWVGIMLDTMDRHGCTAESTDCGFWWSSLYFVTFIVIESIIMLNLFTAVIIESFEKTQRTEDWAVQPSAVEDFVEAWAELDDGSCLLNPPSIFTPSLMCPHERKPGLHGMVCTVAHTPRRCGSAYRSTHALL